MPPILISSLDDMVWTSIHGRLSLWITGTLPRTAGLVIRSFASRLRLVTPHTVSDYLPFLTGP